MSSIELKDDLPAMSPQTAKQVMLQYQAICSQMLDENDVQKIGNKSFKKRSAYRKLARAFGISDEIVKEEEMRDSVGQVTGWKFYVRAFTTSGRSSMGVAACTIREREEAKSKHPEHDAYAIAHTRAKNRAISDLLGTGEVSAEEMDSKDYAEKVNAQAASTFGRLQK